MERLKVSGAVRPLYGSLGVKGLMEVFTATGKLKKFFFRQLDMLDVCVRGSHKRLQYTGRFIIFSVNKNIYNRKTKEPTLTFWRRNYYFFNFSTPCI